MILLICRILHVTPRRYCIACGAETMKAYSPLLQAVFQPLGMSLRSCRGCRRLWLGPASHRQRPPPHHGHAST